MAWYYGTQDQSEHEDQIALYALRCLIFMLALVVYALQCQPITSCNYLASAIVALEPYVAELM